MNHIYYQLIFLFYVVDWHVELNQILISLDPLVEEHLSHQQVALLLEKGGASPLTYILNAILLVNVKLISSK